MPGVREDHLVPCCQTKETGFRWKSTYNLYNLSTTTKKTQFAEYINDYKCMYNPMFRPVLKLIWPHSQQLRLRDSWREQLQSCLERSFKPRATRRATGSCWVTGGLIHVFCDVKIIYRIYKLSHVRKRWCEHVDLLGRQWTYHLDCMFINIRRYTTKSRFQSNHKPPGQ